MNARHPASFRDPSGFVFTRDGVLYRQVNDRYRATFDALTASGLFEELTERGWLVPHREVDVEPWDRSTARLVLQPDPVPFISYPYEWCPGQLREAALLTLDAQLLALEHGFTLKDASAFNVQFVDGRPVLIDTLSFEPYVEGRPWVAYGQFCRHFLAPLALARLVDPRLLSLSQSHLDGVPLDLASRLLPASSRYTWGLGIHLHAHASAQRRHADARTRGTGREMSSKALTGLIESLRASVRKQVWEPSKSAWSDYYAARESYSETSMSQKRDVVAAPRWCRVQTVGVRTVWDLGANTGQFSQMAADSHRSRGRLPGVGRLGGRAALARPPRHRAPTRERPDQSGARPGVGA